MVLAIVGLSSWAVSAAVVALSIRWATRRDLLDHANERSSHTTPTPRFGGVGILVGLVPGLVVLMAMMLMPDRMPLVARPVLGNVGSLTPVMLAGIAGGVLVAFATGLVDDLRGIHPLAKLLGQVIAALLPALGGLRLNWFHVPGMADNVALPAWAGFGITVLWLLVMMNVLNFMDGINGLAARFAQAVALAALVGPVNFAGWETLIPLCACLYGSVEGFLGYNVPRARTFMGDCGSQPLGLLLGVLTIHAASLPTSFPPAVLPAVILVSVFLFDVALTLIRRSLRGENILNAHREHLYQRHLQAIERRGAVAAPQSHAITSDLVLAHVWTTCVLGFVYAHFFWRPESTVGQVVLLLSTVAVLAHYYWRVRTTERRAGMA